MTDMRGDVAQRRWTVHLRDDALTVIEYLEARDTLLSDPRQADSQRARIEAVLNQFCERFSWIGLAEREPADQLEGVVRLQTPVSPSESRLRPARWDADRRFESVLSGMERRVLRAARTP